MPLTHVHTHTRTHTHTSLNLLGPTQQHPIPGVQTLTLPDVPEDEQLGTPVIQKEQCQV